MTYEEALAYIHKVSWRGSKPGLSRVRELCGKSGDPQKNLKFIHVAGTNGKGSFCSMMTSVLRAAGLHVGTFTSPYVVRFNDRMCFDGQQIPDEELAALTAEIMPYAEEMEDKPTEFELITALGMVWFARKNCDVVVLECGMGGRFDSTNVIGDSLLSVITGIALDHTAILGDTVEKIAWEKAGIIKKNGRVVLGEVPDGAREVIFREAAAQSASVTETDYSRLCVREQTLMGTRFDFGERHDLVIRLLGEYQPRNASLVLTAVDALKAYFDIPEKAVREGLDKARWCARFELLCEQPPIFYDGGHNPQGVDVFIKSVRTYYRDSVILVTGVMKDKDYPDMVKALTPLCARAVTLTPDNPRALPAEEFAQAFEAAGVPAQPAENEDDAVEKAIRCHRETGKPIFCVGSLYMYEKLAKAIREHPAVRARH